MRDTNTRDKRSETSSRDKRVTNGEKGIPHDNHRLYSATILIPFWNGQTTRIALIQFTSEKGLALLKHCAKRCHTGKTGAENATQSYLSQGGKSA